MDPSTIWIIVIFATGLVAMVIELFIPGAIIGISGFLAVVGSIIYAYYTGQTLLGAILLGLMLLFVPFFFALWKNVIGRMLSLDESEQDFRSSLGNYEELLGKTGTATSPLRPSGTALIEGNRYAVVTRGEMLDKGTPVKVVNVAGSRLTVAKLKPGEENGENSQS
jgi:membrane-bound serine protease (ClpP class)